RQMRFERLTMPSTAHSETKRSRRDMANSIDFLVNRAACYGRWWAVTCLAAASIAHAQSQSPGKVSPPNGTYSQTVNDLSVQTAAGEISWQRLYNGKGWRFNRHSDGVAA